MSNTSTAFFQITGEFTTNHARNLWAEGSFRKCFDFLECLEGITIDQIRGIVDGKLKLTGVNDLDLVEDNWIPSQDYKNFSFIFDAAENSERATEIIEEYHRDKIEGLKRSYELAWSNGQAKKELCKEFQLQIIALEGKEYFDNFFFELNNPRQGNITFQEITKKPPAIKAGHEFLSLGFDNLLGRVSDRGYKSTENPVQDKNFEGKYGWVLRDGKFYSCGYMEHIGLAYNLLKNEVGEDANHEQIAEKRGWVKICNSGIYETGREATKKQKDALEKYCEKWGRSCSFLD